MMEVLVFSTPYCREQDSRVRPDEIFSEVLYSKMYNSLKACDVGCFGSVVRTNRPSEVLLKH